jgi:hypothetical protein
MNKRSEELALRKEVLLAHSSLCRLKIHYQADVLRHSFSWRGAATAVAAAPPARAALFLLAAEGLGHARMARWLTFAGRALAVARLTRLALALLRKSA